MWGVTCNRQSRPEWFSDGNSNGGIGPREAISIDILNSHGKVKLISDQALSIYVLLLSAYWIDKLPQ